MLSWPLAFAEPAVLWLALPWTIFWLWFVYLQRRSLGEARSRVGRRFRSLVTRYSGKSLALHSGFVFLLGVVAIVAAAGPGPDEERSGTGGPGRLLLLLDGSASMYASDLPPLAPGMEKPANRFELAKEIGIELVDGLEGFEFAVASFSGVATLHLPLTRDRELVRAALTLLENHSYYRNTGSSFSEGLSTSFHFFDEKRGPLQVVLLSDGELPFEDSYGEALDALAEAGVRVHAVAIGTTTGQTRVIYDFNDVVAKVEQKRVLREYTTRRVDTDLRRISRRTDGRFTVATAATAAEIRQAVQEGVVAEEPVRETPAGREDESLDWRWVPHAVFLLGFLAHMVFVSRRPRADFDFDIERVGDWPGEPRPSRGRVRSGGGSGARTGGRSAVALVSTLIVLSCAGSPERLADRANREGIAKDELGLHRVARRHYERSISYGVRPEIPTHNLARSLTEAEDFSEAHKLFQDALALEPSLAEAHFNDGVALYRWGEAERDPKDCQLERTRELWLAAEKRFADAAELARDPKDLARRARRNAEFVRSEIEAVERLIAEPPEHCRPPPAGGGGGGGGGGEGEDEDPPPAPGGQPPPGEDEEQEGDPEGGEPPPASPPPAQDPPGSAPPPAPGSGPLTEQELDQIGRELERMALQASEEGKYYRRTLPEQFRKEDWSNPDPEIWW